jgi:hypothetical protein
MVVGCDHMRENSIQLLFSGSRPCLTCIKQSAGKYGHSFLLVFTLVSGPQVHV